MNLVFRQFDRRAGSPGVKPKAPGERLPVPAGWRFVACALRSSDGGA